MNVIFGIAVAFLVIGSVLIQHWSVIEALSGGAAAFLGALVGAAAGLGAILAGALYNAKLNRDRDNRLRDEESRAIAVAFRAELGTLISDAEVRLSTIELCRENETDASAVAAFDIPAYVVYANNTHRLGDLGEKIAGLVVSVHGHADHIRLYIAVILAVPYKRALTSDKLDSVRHAFLKLTRRTEMAHNALDAFLGDSERFPNLTDVPAEADPASAPAEPAEPNAGPAP